MKVRMIDLSPFAMLIMIIACSNASLYAEPFYNIVDLGTLPSFQNSDARGINNLGQVVGVSYNTGGSEHAFLWSDGVMKDLGLGFSNAASINNNGQIAGFSGDPYQAFIYNISSHNNQLLGTLPNENYSDARAINDSGQVVGNSFSTTSDNRGAFIYTAGVGMKSLGTLGGSTSYAYGINNSSQVVGVSDTSQNSLGTEHAYLYQNGVMRDLGTLGGSFSAALGVNSSGQVVGFSTTAATLGSGNPIFHAFLTGADGQGMTDLGTIAGYTDSYAYNVNKYGDSVGYVYGSQSMDHAMIDTSSYGMLDLNNLIAPNSGWTLVQAEAINDNGQIVGTGYSPNGGIHAFLLNPGVYTDPSTGLNAVPEPGSILTGITGVLIILGYRSYKLRFSSTVLGR